MSSRVTIFKFKLTNNSSIILLNNTLVTGTINNLVLEFWKKLEEVYKSVII